MFSINEEIESYTPFIILKCDNKGNLSFNLNETSEYSRIRLGLPRNPLLNALWMPYEYARGDMSLRQKKRRIRK